MPGTVASFGRSPSITFSACGRWSRGLSRENTRPLLSTTLEPAAPMNDMFCCTAGSCRMISATARCFSAIASNEMSCAVSVNAKIVPLSSVGMNPFGMTTKK
jgi:hypothetical protein